MKGIVKYLDGKKTYIQALLVGVVAVVLFLNIIDIQTATLLFGLLGAGSIASMRVALDK